MPRLMVTVSPMSGGWLLDECWVSSQTWPSSSVTRNSPRGRVATDWTRATIWSGSFGASGFAAAWRLRMASGLRPNSLAADDGWGGDEVLAVAGDALVDRAAAAGATVD